MSRVWFGLLVILLGAFVVWRLSFLSEMPRAVVHLSIDARVSSPVALSRDGSALAYVELHGDDTFLHLRQVEGGDVKRLTGTDGAAQPVFSPDGASIAYTSSGRVMQVATREATPVKLAEIAEIDGMCWTDEGEVLAGTREGLVAIPNRQVTMVDDDETGHRHPEVLPGGRWVLFDNGSRIDAASLETGERHTVVRDGIMPRYAGTGHLLFVRERSLWAIAFDRERAEISGSRVLVFEGIGSWYDVAENGTFGFSRPEREGEPTIVSIIINWYGELERLTGLR